MNNLQFALYILLLKFLVINDLFFCLSKLTECLNDVFSDVAKMVILWDVFNAGTNGEAKNSNGGSKKNRII